MIHWFPGHMAKQFRLLQEKQKLFDLFIVVMDARLPKSSFNEEIFKIINNKPILFVFNKADKTNLAKLNPFLEKYQKRGQVVITNLKNKDGYAKINNALNKEFLKFKAKNDLKGKLTPALKCVVLGVPNVGKSTLINTMSKSKSTKVGAIAGITRSEQWINCKNYMLLDTPGLLMPKIESDETGAKLAIVGSIRQEAIDINELIVALYRLMSKYYPEKLTEIKLEPTFSEEEIFDNLAKYTQINNLLLKNGVYDIKKGINMLINYFKNLNNVIFDVYEEGK
ncbi:ribosome biogenesis GTPase YlqF [Mycoplasmopsis arginini]|uniref:ribosome biogenesis GTPase YlqF n=1 Tax=Mycoplasmopsis arginini TaxID=2094 RepID=UPI00227C7128|nr:ribosome biogenesis GTPase YlqF [Mycoplasmopsis arginini]MCY2902971.1 ribosome biogenesis GTPase YlqF [Mycoplasmopsis arginini QMP CG1-2758]MDI3350098.1 ribosome biogenesis GTPase YlqF [Mycoplasmopsis arginini]MDI3350667.1 ribosome biogenesis GTPase YlqF [Mycoplasmopsis arginini]MDI3352647.1 ribosome biogenesis GTPase YlqF [Mycoplasmopsis arginini]